VPVGCVIDATVVNSILSPGVVVREEFFPAGGLKDGE